PLPKALKPDTSIWRKLPPYAISSVTVAMPHTMPSMVRALRVRLRRRAAQASPRICRSTLSSCLIAQSFDGVDGGRPARRIERRQNCNRAENGKRDRAGLPGRQQSGEEIRHREEMDQRAEAERDCQPDSTADEGD